ncbi:LPXTG cell wall anchor domain-containing protein [Limosilactobacillus caecicola]|uniref:LPXTG cell wall anchor domain-containing protein n=1 Tax=Limosilactobacillus caecicola TaxID=2941332 RepID=UPI00203F8998|nr:LPXTG cell wall anchor domain-containing protein [Limosilactobacillus caecicola]
MKISKWQRQVLYICAIGGVLVITTPYSVKADVNVGTLIAHTNAATELTTHQTTRLVIAKLVNGTVLQQKQTMVNWVKDSASALVPDVRFTPPTIDGYINTGGLIRSSMMENPAAPLNVFHLDYYPNEEQINPFTACCRIDLKDESGKVYISHIYCVPNGVQRQVNLELPEGMEFVNPSDQAYKITGENRGQFTVMIKPATQADKKDDDVDSETAGQPNAEKNNTADGAKPDTPDKNVPGVSDSNEQVDNQEVNQQVDQGKNTEETMPSGSDKEVQTDPTQPDTSSTTLVNEGTNTDPIDQVTESTNTDDNNSELVDHGSQTDPEPTLEKPDLDEQSGQISPPKHPGGEVIQRPELVDHEAQTTIEEDDLVTNTVETVTSTEDLNNGSTHADEQNSALINQDYPSRPSVQLAIAKEPTEMMKIERINEAKDEEVKQPSATALTELAKYNRPSEDKKMTANQQLPQTGNHTGQLLVACGVALLALLGLFRNRSKH